LHEIQDYLNVGAGFHARPIPLEQRLQVIKEHLNLAACEKGEYIAVREMRKHICYYIKNLPASSQVRQEINTLETKEDVINCLETYFNML